MTYGAAESLMIINGGKIEQYFIGRVEQEEQAPPELHSPSLRDVLDLILAPSI